MNSEIKHLIAPTDILLPAASVNMGKWAVLACDQFTSQPEYWLAADALVGSAPSALRLVLPEVYLDDPDVADRIERVHAAMADYEKNVLTRCVHGFIYTERATESGTRKGLLAALDLEAYSYAPGEQPLIRPTERTVPERIPPRLAVRRGALLELPHVLMLLNDEARSVIEPLAARKDSLVQVYDTELMLGGGHAAGWAVTDPAMLAELTQKVDAFGASGPIAIAVGDGNHSLATAKAYWEELKPTLTEAERQHHPARFALAEIENIYDEAICMEPIHRVLFGADETMVLEALQSFFGDRLCNTGDQRFTMVCENGDTPFGICRPHQPLCVGSVEEFLADFLSHHSAARVDYIHGEAAVRSLSVNGAVGFLLPPFDKSSLFPCVYACGTLPKKTFSMGHAEEKRYYLEARKITG